MSPLISASPCPRRRSGEITAENVHDVDCIVDGHSGPHCQPSIDSSRRPVYLQLGVAPIASSRRHQVGSSQNGAPRMTDSNVLQLVFLAGPANRCRAGTDVDACLVRVEPGTVFRDVGSRHYDWLKRVVVQLTSFFSLIAKLFFLRRRVSGRP